MSAFIYFFMFVFMHACSTHMYLYMLVNMHMYNIFRHIYLYTCVYLCIQEAPTRQFAKPLEAFGWPRYDRQEQRRSPRGDACLRCFVWWLSVPSKSYEEFCEFAHGTSKESKRLKRGMDSFDASNVHHGLKPATVMLDESTGYVVKAPYVIWSAREFLDEFEKDHKQFLNGKVKLLLTTIVNEFGQQEEVIVARQGPRVLEFMNIEMTKKSEAIMHHHVREGQASETFSWAVAKTQQEAWLKFHTAKTRVPTVSQIADAVQSHNESLEQREKKEEEERSGDSSADGGSGTDEEGGGGGLAMPRRRGALQQKQQDKTKAAARKRAPTKDAPVRRRKGLSVQPLAQALSASSSLSAGVSVSLSGAAVAVGGRAGGAKAASSSAVSVVSVACDKGAALASPGSARKKSSSGYFEWDKVLSGETTGTALSGARRHLATLTGQTKLYNKLSQEIELFEHMKVFKLSTLDTVPLAKMQHTLPELRRLGGASHLPIIVWSTLCIKFGVDLLQKEKFVEFAQSCRPWAFPSEPKFNSASPHLSALVASRLPDMSADTQDELASAMLEMYFSDALCKLFAEPVEKDVLAPPCEVEYRIAQ